MDNSNSNENNRQNVNYDPLNTEALNKLLRESKGIESLWKTIKDNKDKKKSSLCEYEKNLVELFGTFTESFKEAAEKYNKTTGKDLDLGKSMQSKEEYKVMVTKFLPGTGEADAFVKKFPHWTIQVCSLFTNSIHYKRISTGVSGAKVGTDNITDSSTFDVQKKDGVKKTGYESEKTNKGILKKINLFWNRYFKRGGLGKASKSKVTIELKKFGDYVNKPWRKWWEVVCSSGEKLSNSKPKSLLKEALGNSTPDAQKKAVLNLFNMGTPNGSAEGKTKIHNQHISGFDDLSKFNQDSFKDQLNVMFNVFTSLDKSLGNKVRKLFGEQPIEDKSAIGKVWDKTKGMFGGNKKGASQNINLNESEQNIGGSAPQTSGSNLTFDQSKVDAINKILNDNSIPENDKIKNLKDNNKVNTVLQIIQQKIGGSYLAKGDRPKFLVKIAEYLGLKGFSVSNIQEVCKSQVKKIPEKYRNNAVFAVQRVRNLIRHGYDWGTFKNGKNDDLPLELK